MRTCAICKKEVPQGYEQDHLQSNHLGPHTFWFEARKYVTEKPSMTVAEIMELAGSIRLAHFFEERDGKQIFYGHDTSVDLTHQPHFFILLPATI